MLEKIIVFFSAFLLFWLELFFAKLLLPKFGGGPVVWVGCLACYQVLLFLGYSYVSFLSKKKGFMPVHIGVMALSTVILPIRVILIDALDIFKILQTLQIVFVSVGLPFLVLSSVSPLLQYWRSARANPYELYAWSNAGSLVSLVTYPAFLEPRLGLSIQGMLWSVCYMIICSFILLIGVLRGKARYLIRSIRPTVTSTDPLKPRQKVRWVLFAAIPTCLLSGVTAYATLDLAPDPILWAVFLGLYLISFILPFLKKPIYAYPSIEIGVAFLVLVLCPIRVLVPPRNSTILSLVAIAFFFVCWAYHSRLAATKPEPGRLTEFYFWVSFGGMIGGLFSIIIAPNLFNQTLEFHYLLVISIPFLIESQFQFRYPQFALRAGWIYSFLLIFFLSQSTTFFDKLNGTKTLIHERSFFGAHTVYQRGNERGLLNGMTLHGIQIQGVSEPTGYYSRESPIADVFMQKPRHTAVIGMGIGAMAAYVPNETQQMTFYEIDPLVKQIAQRYFSYLKKEGVSSVIGDGRLEIAKSSENYDLIVLDAFSSDGLPVHLMTLEAMQLYQSKLNPSGVLAYHTSNWYVDLAPIIARQADKLNLVALVKETHPKPDPIKRAFASKWVIVVHPDNAAIFKSLGGWQPIASATATTLWTDDRSSVFSARSRQSS